MKRRLPIKLPRLILSGTAGAVALTAGLLAAPASRGPYIAAPHVPAAEAAPVAARRGCSPTIGPGARGDYVEYLQILLNENFQGPGLPPLAVDGITGPLTWSALGAC